MTIKKCDRCGAYYDFVPNGKGKECMQLRMREAENISNYRVIDLCPKCRGYLEQWAMGEKSRA